jgi:hypothetical protein
VARDGRAGTATRGTLYTFSCLRVRPKPAARTPAKLRGRWASDTKSLKPAALTILKALQPPNDTGDGTEADRLQVIDSLSNRDRHERLPPVIVSGLDRPNSASRVPTGGTTRARQRQREATLFAA